MSKYGTCHERDDDITRTEEVLQDKDTFTKERGIIGGVTENETETGVYKTRWYILLVLCLSNMLNNDIWASWGPIAQSAKAVYGWTDSTIATMINFSNAGVICVLFLAGYIINSKGIRVSMLLCTGLVTFGNVLRAITTQKGTATYLMAAGQFFNGLSTSLSTIMPAVLTETWFPTNERNLATALGILSASAGGATAFTLGPFLVYQPPSSCLNTTDNSTICQHAIDVTTQQIRLLNLIQLVWAAVLFLLTILYFPAKPWKPPSLSSNTVRLNFKTGLLQVIQRPQLLVIVILSGGPGSVVGTWLGMMDVNLNGVGISQDLSGWFGFSACLSSLIGGVLIGKLADILQHRSKAIAIVVTVLTVVAASWVTGMRNGFLPRSDVQFGVSITLLATMSAVLAPLCFELGCEEAYPIPESIIGTLSGLVNNIASFLFLLVNLDPNIGTSWMNWTVVGTFSISVVMLIGYKGHYRRLSVDLKTVQNITSERDPLLVNDLTETS